MATAIRSIRLPRHHLHRDVLTAVARTACITAAPNVTLVEIADTGHFALNQKPADIAAIVLQAVNSVEAG